MAGRPTGRCCGSPTAWTSWPRPRLRPRPPTIVRCSFTVLLKYVQDDHSILRAVSVIKSRASYHHSDIRPFQIGGDGIVLTGSLRPPDGR